MNEFTSWGSVGIYMIGSLMHHMSTSRLQLQIVDNVDSWITTWAEVWNEIFYFILFHWSILVVINLRVTSCGQLSVPVASN